MKDKWYADNRDLVKWSVLIHLAKQHSATRIFQVAYYRPDIFATIEIDGKPHPLPSEVIKHFRGITNITQIKDSVPIEVYDKVFENRKEYLQGVLEHIGSFGKARIIVFLDPDTGLEPAKPSAEHVLRSEANAIWQGMKNGDLLVFYQHQTNRNGTPWIEPKKSELATALDVKTADIKIASGSSIARDVVFYYIQK